ncbi:MAG: NAD(P)-dependent oxidoreductase [Phycisphaerales bacterium]
MTILVADKFEKAGIDGLRGLGLNVINQPDAGAGNLAGAIVEAKPAILVIRSSKTPASAIDAGAGGGKGTGVLKAIIRAGAGYDNIDCAAASARGVAVCNCPGTNAAAVAELVLGLLLTLDRRIVEQTLDLRAGKWNKKEYSKARGIKGQVLGVIGAGGIGREVIHRAKAFGMTCIVHSLNMTRERAADLEVEFGGSTREQMLAMLPRCDAVSIMVAANAESERMCDGPFFDAMKPGAAFINTARGSVVCEDALAAAVKSKGLRAAADVFAGEPAGATSVADWKTPLVDLPGFIGTHHVGASTDQAQNAVAEEVVRIVKVFQETGRWENRVN